MKKTCNHKSFTLMILRMLLSVMAGVVFAGEAAAQLPVGSEVRNKASITFVDKSKTPFTEMSNEVITPTTPAIVKLFEAAAETLVAGDQLIYKLVVDNRNGDPVDITLKDTIDAVLDVQTLIAGANVQIDGQIITGTWTPFGADFVDTITVITHVRNVDPMPLHAFNRAFLTVGPTTLESELIETPLKTIGQTADGEIEQPEFMVPGEFLNVTVRDADLNVSPFVSEQVTVIVTNTRTGEKESVILTATGPDSDEYTAQLTSLLDFNDNGTDFDGTMHVQPADFLQGVYHDTRTQAGPPVDRTDETQVLPTEITLVPNPRVIIGNGRDQSILTARVTDSLGRPLPDNTPVTFVADKGTFPNGLLEIIIPVSGGNGEAEVVYTAPILDANDTTNVTASFGGFDSDIVELRVLPGAIGIRVFDQVRSIDVTSLDDELTVELTVFGTTSAGNPFGPVTISVDESGLFNSDLLPPGNYTFVTRIKNIQTGEIEVENEPQNFVVNFDGSVSPPKNTIAGSITARNGSGQQFAGLTVELLDAAGNVVGSVVTGPNGEYKFDGLDPNEYTLRVQFADGSVVDTPIDPRSRLVGQIIVNVEILIDPFGQTFDAVTGALIPAVTVDIQRLDGSVLPIPLLGGTGAAPNVNNINPFVTDAVAKFAFLFGGNQVGTFGTPVTYQMTATPVSPSSPYLPRKFFIEVEPVNPGPIGNDSQIRLRARSADGLELAEANSFTLTTADVIIPNIATIAINIPMFTQAPALQITKFTAEDTLQTSQPFDYFIAIANTGNDVAPGVTVTDTLNPVTWNLLEAPGAVITPNKAVWNIGDMAPGAVDTLRLRVEIVPPKPNGILAINTATIRMNRGQPLSSESGVFINSTIRTSAITLEPDPKTIVGNGTDFSFLTARVVDNNNDPLPDGTPVTFTTDKGLFENGTQTITIPISGGDGEAVTVYIAPILTNNDTANVTASFDGVASNTVNLEVLPGAVGVRVWDQVRDVEVVGGDSDYRVDVNLVGTSATGQPIGVSVNLDSRGIFAVPDIPPGTYRLKTNVTDLATGRVVSDGALQTITVNFDGSTTQPKNGISGKVTARGEVSGARYQGLEVQLVDSFGSIVGTTVIDEKGEYDFQNLEPGEYRIRFTLPDGTNFDIPVHRRSRLSGSIVINVDVLIDPFGQTYDAFTGALIPNIKVTLETLDGTPLPIPTLPGTGATPNINNINPYDTDAQARFAFLFAGNQVGTFGNPVTYILRATPPDTSAYLPRRIILEVQPTNPGPITSTSPITVTYRLGDVLEIAKPSSFELTRDAQTIPDVAVTAINIPLFKTAPFMEMTKTAVPDTVIPGNQTRYDIIVRNTGNESAVNVTVRDTLDSRLRLVTASAGGAVVGPNILQWVLGDMAPGRKDSLWIQVELIAPQLNGTVVPNTAHATTPRGIDVSASDNIVAAATPTWEIIVRPLINVVGPGEEIPWVIRFKNIGDETARGFTLVDSIPANQTPVWVTNGEGDTTLTAGSLEIESSHTSDLYVPTGVINGQSIAWTLKDYAPGEVDSSRFVTRANLSVRPNEILREEAFIFGPTGSVWAASAAAIPIRGPKISLTKTATKDTVNVGQTVDFILVAKNNENVPLTAGLTLTDSLPSALQLLDAFGKPTVSSNVLTWSLPALNPGQADTQRVSVRVITDEPTIKNIASLRYFDVELTDEAVVGVKPAPTVSISKTASETLIGPGQEVEYTLTMTALGDTISTLEVKDALPAELAYVSGSSNPAAVYDTLNHTLTWNFAAVAPGAQTTMTFRLRPSDNLRPGEYLTSNVVAATTPDSTFTSGPADVVVSVPFFVITKSSAQNVAEVGDFVTYRLTLENLSANDDLTNVRVWDRLPHSFKYLKGSARLNSQPLGEDSIIGRDVIWIVPSLPAGSVFNLSYRVVIGTDGVSSDGVNVVNATATTPVGNTLGAGPARAKVRVRPDVFSQSQVIIGRAWVDENDNGLHDDGEPPVPGVAFMMEDGTRVVADGKGRFSVPEIRSGAHVMRLLARNVPDDLYPVELGVRSAGDPWIRFVDVSPAGLTKANFPFKRVVIPPSTLQKTASAAPEPARFWIERTVRLEKRGVGTEEAFLDMDFLESMFAGPEDRAAGATLNTKTKKEAAGATPKVSGNTTLGKVNDAAAATPKALDSRFKATYRIYALGAYEDALITIFQAAPQGYLFAPPDQRNTGTIVPGDSLELHLAADVLDIPFMPQPRLDMENVPTIKADSTISIQLTLQTMGRAFSDSTIREVWYVEQTLPQIMPEMKAEMPVEGSEDLEAAVPDSTMNEETAPVIYSGGKVQYTLDVYTHSGGEIIDRIPPGMTPVETDSLATVEGDTIRWVLPQVEAPNVYQLWTRMTGETNTTVTRLNEAILMENDPKQVGEMTPGPKDSASVIIEPRPEWVVTSDMTPDSVFVEIENTVLEALGADSFISGSAVLIDVVRQQLLTVRDRVLAAPTQIIKISGHTDSNPINTRQYPDNFVLSMARANAVKDYLVSQGVAENRIATFGFAATRPVASNATAEGRRQNRRVELELVETVIDRVPFDAEFARTTTVTYQGEMPIRQAVIVDSLGAVMTYVADSATTPPLVSPGALQWVWRDIQPGDSFTVTYGFEAVGEANGDFELCIPTVVSYSLPDNQWVINPSVIDECAVISPVLDEDVNMLQQRGTRE